MLRARGSLWTLPHPVALGHAQRRLGLALPISGNTSIRIWAINNFAKCSPPQNDASAVLGHGLLALGVPRAPDSLVSHVSPRDVVAHACINEQNNAPKPGAHVIHSIQQALLHASSLVPCWTTMQQKH